MKIILASASPRRKELLGQLVEDFQIIPADINEDRRDKEGPETYVQRLSLEKAEAIAIKHPDSLVLGADTTVAFGDRVLNKPKDKDRAREFLQLLSGQTHRVCSAYTLICQTQDISITRISITEVKFIDIPEPDLESYLDSDEPYDKAGAYAIQGEAAEFVQSINGSYNSVVGLDTEMLAGDLQACFQKI